MARPAPIQRSRMLLTVFVLLVFAAVLWRSAWVSDDAFITLRQVDNALNGYGLRWNVVERVQAYTHPLWMLLLLVVHGITGEPWFGTMALGAALSLVCVGWIVARARSEAGALGACALLLSSKAWVDFATSGLENPLTHLLLIALFTSLVRGGERPADLARTAVIVALAMCNRLDAAVLFVPGLVAHLLRAPHSPRHLGAATAGFAPLMLWSAFATVYYGSPLPNTAFAKLANGYPLLERLGQGLLYVQHLVLHDPMSALALAAVPVLAMLQRDRPALALAAGGLAHLGYIVWAGGDFMAGRWFTPVVTIAAVLIARQAQRGFAIAPGVMLLASLALAQSPLRAALSPHKLQPWNGIVDERGFYWNGASLHSRLRGRLHPWAREGRTLGERGVTDVVRGAVGMYGYYAGPDVHLIDPFGLSEPLLARVKARYDPNWRVGHYRRGIPEGYAPSTDAPPSLEALHPLWEVVHSVTRDPLFSPTRWGHLLAFHTLRASPQELRFGGVMTEKTGQIKPRGVGFDGTLEAIRCPRGDRWMLVFLPSEADHRVTCGPEWTALPQAPAGNTRTLLYPANARNRAQRLGQVRHSAR